MLIRLCISIGKTLSLVNIKGIPSSCLTALILPNPLDGVKSVLPSARKSKGNIIVNKLIIYIAKLSKWKTVWKPLYFYMNIKLH